MTVLKRTESCKRMCLSTVYKNEIADGNVLMTNVMSVECTDSQVILTDLMGRKLSVDGKLLKAELTDGYVILKAE